MEHLDNHHYVESPFEGTLVVDGEKIYIRYVYGDVMLAEIQARKIREALGDGMLLYFGPVHFVILPIYVNSGDYIGLVTVPDNMFQKYEQEEAH